jgi:membrane fusion protein (multidrug efflux system)
MGTRPKGVFFLLGAIAIVALLVLPKLFSSNKMDRKIGSPAASRGRIVTVRTEAVTPQAISEKIVAVGTVLPNEEVEIRSEASGKIERMSFDEGSSVSKGELLVKINDADLQAQLLRASARAELAALQESRVREMFDQNLASQQEYDRALSELNVANAEVKLTEAQIEKTEIRAPFAGVIGLRYVSEGSYVSPATRIATLQDSRVVKVEFSIPEKYAGVVKEGDKINFATPGLTEPAAGTIYALESKIDPATRTLRLRALSPNPDGSLFAGAFANVEVVLREKNALMIPSYALVPELKGQKVFVYEGGKAVARSVEIGLRTDEKVEITNGLEPGDTLITSGVLQLRQGTAVQPAR